MGHFVFVACQKIHRKESSARESRWTPVDSTATSRRYSDQVTSSSKSFRMEGLIGPSLYSVKGIVFLDNDGNRILAKYYDDSIYPSLKEQREFEKNLFAKTHKANSEILMYDGLTVVYKQSVDLFFYVLGSSRENEILLTSVLNCVFDSISQVLRKAVEKRSLYDNLDVTMLIVDEVVDGGIVMESDANSLVQRVAVRSEDIPLGEQTVAQVKAKIGEKLWSTGEVLQSAKDQLKWSLLK